MRLKFWSLTPLDHQNMPKPIPHCSNFVKMLFLAWEGVKCPKLKNLKKQALSGMFGQPKSWCPAKNSNFYLLSPYATSIYLMYSLPEFQSLDWYQFHWSASVVDQDDVVLPSWNPHLASTKMNAFCIIIILLFSVWSFVICYILYTYF